MVAWRYGISLLLFNLISHLFAGVSCEISSWTPKEKFSLLYKHQWNTKWAFPQKLHIFTHEDNMLCSYVKRSPSLWLHNKSCLWKQADLEFHWCLCNKQNITYSLTDMNFIFSCSTRVDHYSYNSHFKPCHAFLSILWRCGIELLSLYFALPIQKVFWHINPCALKFN